MKKDKTILSHLNTQGNPHMVDVSQKEITIRSATAHSTIQFPPAVFKQLIKNNFLSAKGSIFHTAIVAGTMAAKRTADLIPLCHPLALSQVNIDIEKGSGVLLIKATIKCQGKTGVEMEALTAASVAALTVYDMCKALSHDIIITETRLVEKKEAKVILKNDLYGLVLAGGKSSRMQTDKGELQYHDSTTQRTYLYKMLSSFCSRTFVSCRNDQVSNLQIGEEYIVDENLYQGPLNGILSAYHRFPDKAWMVLAVDLPHITDKTIEALISERDPLKLATVYVTHLSQNPEPLVGIWEPAALEEAEKYIQTGNHCPRKFLTSKDIKTVFPANDMELFNANFYTDYLEAKKRMAAS